MESACKPVERLMQSLVCPSVYTGIDVSVAPTCGSDAIDTSLVTAYEAVIPKFGGAGTLTISAMITGVLKTLDILVCIDNITLDRFRMILFLIFDLHWLKYGIFFFFRNVVTQALCCLLWRTLD
jgi:hypothetical protein